MNFSVNLQVNKRDIFKFYLQKEHAYEHHKNLADSAYIGHLFNRVRMTPK